ncbi:putative hemolysin [Hydromonas duriensis]|uniref:Hemolysin n=1 Tax=Hydromonas duriensis TaxID=1527608 RepID=A0A4R6Y8T7_9BURK|nr:DUF333 domain-containing protein [Hydromonas duriensis]TDR31827.1 hypothetical protein DFR44_10744 [Hydromonas duriensis]
MKKISLMLLLLSGFGLQACVAPKGPKPAEKPMKPIGMANPASVYCIEQGGELSIKKDANGNEYGICTFKNGKSCDEWAFFRKECSAELDK